MSNEKILVVEDEVDLAKMVGKYIQNEGFEVKVANDGNEALDKFNSFKPQLIILDIMLPKIDGMELCRIIRSKSDIPVIMLSAKSSDIDKVLSLGLGADDYITKPFSAIELIARVKAHIRRYVKQYSNEDSIIKINNLEINNAAYTAKVNGKQLILTSKEFKILSFLCKHPNQVFSKEQIYGNVWGFNEYGEINAVVVYINKLREKLREVNGDYIKTVWGVGYKLEE